MFQWIVAQVKSGTPRAFTRIPLVGAMVVSLCGVFSSNVAAQAQASFVYVANNNPTVSLYSVQADTGSLIDAGVTPIGPTSSAFCLGLNPTQTLMYVCDNTGQGTWGFSVDADNGALTPLAGSPFPFNALSLAVDPTGTFLVSAEAGGGVSSYRIDPESGNLTMISRVIGGTPWSLTFEPTGQYVYVVNVNSNTVSGFRLNAETGQLVPVPGSPFSAGLNPFRVVADPSGRFLYVPNANGANLSAYTIDQASGALAPISGSPFPTGQPSYAIVIDATGSYLYVARYFQSIDGFSIDPNTGALSPLQGSPFPAGDSTALDLAADRAGQFIYAANHDAGEISVLALDGTSGQLSVSSTTPSPGAPLAIGLIYPMDPVGPPTNEFAAATSRTRRRIW